MKFTKKSIYIGLFSILYLIVAFSSFFHACSFFGLANNVWMSIILAFAFEVGQAAVLFSLLTSSKDRSRIMPWVLMFMFTLVQVIGNVFSSYKYIVTNSVDDLRYFKEPIFIWTNIPDDQATVIIVYLVGALLPIAALLLTSMVTNYLSDQEEQKELEKKEDTKEESEKNDDIDKDEEIEKLKEQLKSLENDKAKKMPVSDSGSNTQNETETNDDKQSKIEKSEDDAEDIEEHKPVAAPIGTGKEIEPEPEPEPEPETEQPEPQSEVEESKPAEIVDEPHEEIEEEPIIEAEEPVEKDEFKDLTPEQIEEIKRRRASKFVNLK